ncbi:MAG: hypothetical protein F6K00_25305 [Leptolyngbya sp. SIOISBB]|nr:hypothetical protein [Leptolyngbya sp. SIOISBB]
MNGQQPVKLTISFIDPQLDDDNRDEQAQLFINELCQLGYVDTANRKQNSKLPEGSKGVGGMLVGVLTAEVKFTYAKKLLSFIGNRLSSRPIELEVETQKRRLKFSVSDHQDLEKAIRLTQEFLEQG